MSDTNRSAASFAAELGLLPSTILEERWVGTPDGLTVRIGEAVSWDGVEWPFAAGEPIAPPKAPAETSARY